MTTRTPASGLRRAAAAAILCLLAACTPINRFHGFIPPPEDLALVEVGVDTRETVTQKVGPPTAGGVLDNSGFYYVQSRFRHFGALAPQEVDRQVLAISFDAGGTVSNIESFGLEDGRVVVLSRRVTDSSVRDTTLLRQILGSIGRVDAQDFLGEN